ncbi:anthranilate synthase component I family protein [Agrococcus sp. ARC_14]|uniref:anthranilate synthase component I family protein n=1 Tax=Agrococcus sp. ARC_14 TaxID=2919927 RepID=UPI001F06977B|nr:anthranilate synthase component I family protein [Agrococcus sp. ARC_14]MCH1882932.1 anthranilate synthase component I family protein [Agrococcus sp. ARC_14]
MPATSAPLLPHLGARWAVPSDLTPEAAFAALESASDDVVWLDSSSDGDHVIGTGAHALVMHDGEAFLDGEPLAGDAVAALEAARATHPGAWVGWFGYEAGVRMLGLAPGAEGTDERGPGADSLGAGRFPEAAWLLLDRWLVVADGEAQLQSRDGEPWSLEAAPVRQPSAKTLDSSLLRWRDDDAGYAEKVERCREHIREGDSYVLCLTTAIAAPPIDAIATHARLRAASPVHHGGLLRIAGVTVSSASPETFLRVEQGIATTRPIKGTRRRGAASGGDDAALALELFESEKERAENVMIVDLCRNDLQRVCAPGSVEVTSLLAVETYPTVHQLVSTVRGRLLPGLGPLDTVRALFPAGSMTGAPKRRTVELLQALEGGRRGVYSGCFGLVAGETCQLAMVIRSVVADEHGTHIGVGGGVTALSEPAFEVEELHVKAAALLASLVPR